MLHSTFISLMFPKKSYFYVVLPLGAVLLKDAVCPSVGPIQARNPEGKAIDTSDVTEVVCLTDCM